MTAQLLKALLLSCRPALLRFLSLRGASTDEAEDVLQDLFVTLEGRAIGEVADPRAYLYRMTDNLWLDRRRAAQRRTRREEDYAGMGSGPPDTDEIVIARQELALIEAALGALPERTVEVFRRFRIDGEPQKGIAAQLGISVSAVEKHLQKAYAAVLAVRRRFDAENDGSRRLSGESEHHDD